MGDNANTSPPTSIPKSSAPGNITSPLVNAVNTSNDTDPMAFPEGGTNESDFSKWMA